MSRIELGYSYELGSGWTRIRVLTRPRKRSGTVMTGCKTTNKRIKKQQNRYDICYLPMAMR